MSPDKLNEAAVMAQHFQATYKLVAAKKGKIVKSFPLLPVKEKQMLIDTFVIILAAAEAESRTDDMKLAGQR